MARRITHMLVINLHETNFLKETLDILTEEFVRDCVVYDAEGIVSRHGNEIPSFGFFSSGISNVFKEKHNQNCVIMAVVSEENQKNIRQKLKELTIDDRWAASFWFMPIDGYFYHKGYDQLD